MYKKILVPLDGSQLAECVLPHMETIAQGCGMPTVVLLRVVEPFYMSAARGGGEYIPSAEVMEKMQSESNKDAENYLAGAVRRLKYDGVKKTETIVSGPVAETIADYAAKNQFDLIVIATHGRSGVSRWVWGSVADKLLRSTCVPVLMVRAPGCVPGI